MTSVNDKNVLVAQVATASPLSDAARARLVEKLTTQAGQPVELEERVTPAVIGGIRVQLGDRLYDATVLARLRAVRSALVNAGEV
ncbi:MAG: F0F1 ATP synthase subunit delta [Actinomycetes bacterium]|jgi:F-type H+-transporting ATPase subunit delta|nr:F0F1 ATP synthase subunit delta [Actinomycetes bacterium]